MSADIADAIVRVEEEEGEEEEEEEEEEKEDDGEDEYEFCHGEQAIRGSADS